MNTESSKTSAIKLRSDQTVRLILPSTYPKQKAFIDDTHRYTLIESGTKTGKTLGMAIWVVRQAWMFTHTNWWWSAPVYHQTAIGFNRCMQLIPHEERDVNLSKLMITMSNGSTIQGRSGEKPDNLFGDEVNGGVIDEASRYREESFHAFRTTLTRTKGQMKIIGNPKGKKNWFWKLCQKAKDSAETEFSYHHLATIDNPYIEPKEIEDARRLLPEYVFRELYLGEAQEDESGVFRNIKKLATASFLESPIPKRAYVLGYDPARTQDNAVACVMDRSDRVVVACERLPRVGWEVQLERVAFLANKWNNCRVIADSTGIGDVLYDWLKKKGVTVEPFKFTNETKQQLIENLAVDMEHENIRYPNIQELIAELEMFEYRVLPSGKVQYSAPEGYNDDCVIALALADWGCRGRLIVLDGMSLKDGRQPSRWRAT